MILSVNNFNSVNDWCCFCCVGSAGDPNSFVAAANRPSPSRFVNCVCNGLKAVLDTRRMMMKLPNGREMSGNEFERAAGKASAKKWKVRFSYLHCL